MLDWNNFLYFQSMKLCRNIIYWTFYYIEDIFTLLNLSKVVLYVMSDACVERKQVKQDTECGKRLLLNMVRTALDLSETDQRTESVFVWR